MRLSEEKVNILAQKIYDQLKKSPNIRRHADQHKILIEIKKVLLKDLKREDLIDAEVEKILAPYKEKISQTSMNYQVLYKKAKNELAKRKGIVL